ncbi:hypothetical protein PIB30_020373 [Stylosanthes scabra]|uniref:Uncharacterized protein n=1 Tax=Stylosanthes scabra TaxID=79078 RepID=A0ABU6Q9B4_9FABA|nr:hypothetical protein [Stylosanthes scabra]
MGSSPYFKIRKQSAESTQKGSTGRFGVTTTFARREPYLDSFRVVVELREDNRRMGSGIIYYEIERCEKYNNFDKRADSDLAVVKTRRYHFDDEAFIHPLHSALFDPDHPYELLVESLLVLKRREPSAKKDSTPRGSGSSRREVRHPNTLPLTP